MIIVDKCPKSMSSYQVSLNICPWVRCFLRALWNFVRVRWQLYYNLCFPGRASACPAAARHGCGGRGCSRGSGQGGGGWRGTEGFSPPQGSCSRAGGIHLRAATKIFTGAKIVIWEREKKSNHKIILLFKIPMIWCQMVWKCSVHCPPALGPHFSPLVATEASLEHEKPLSRCSLH